MNLKERQLAAKFLHEASNEYSNHSCNDVPESYYNSWTIKDREKFAKEFHEWNDDDGQDYTDICDSALMDFLAYKLESE